MKDLSFLDIKPEDSLELQELKSRWLMVIDLKPEQREYIYQKSRVAEEEVALQQMIDFNKTVDLLTEHLVHLANKYMSAYKLEPDDELIEMAETVTVAAHENKETRYSIGDIREQRKRVQWEKKILSQIEMSKEQSNSSSP